MSKARRGYDSEDDDGTAHMNPVMEDSFNDLSRAGNRGANALLEFQAFAASQENMSSILRQANRLQLSPLDRFKTIAGIYYQRIGAREFNVNDHDLYRIIETIPKIEYKNPIAFIIAARLLDSNMRLSTSGLKLLTARFATTLKDNNIYPEDIVRYGRFLEISLSKLKA